MKKALLILLVLSIVGAAAFADVKFGAFAAIGLRSDVTMTNSKTIDTLYAWEWFQGTNLIGLATASFVGADPNMGFDTRFIAVNGAGVVPAVDYANAWMKVANGMVAINLGLFQAAEDFETAEQAYGQNTWNVSATPALTVYAYPIEGLTIGYQLPLSITGTASIADNLYNSKIGVRYSMKDVFGLTGGFLMGKAANSSDAYFGVSVNAIQSLGLWFEGLMTNVGSSTAGETDLYLEANYPVAMLKIGVAAEYNLPNVSALKAAWVLEPYVIYPIADKVNLMGAVDIGSAAASGAANVWGWYGLQTGGSANADNGIAWDVFVRASMMSPLGELRVQAKYGSVDSALTGNAAVSYFNVFAGVKWGF
jgi:hypothetical protein